MDEPTLKSYSCAKATFAKLTEPIAEERRGHRFLDGSAQSWVTKAARAATGEIRFDALEESEHDDVQAFIAALDDLEFFEFHCKNAVIICCPFGEITAFTKAESGLYSGKVVVESRNAAGP
jgi:hypothetical protein